MNKLLVIYNVCGISGFQNFIYYEDAIKSVLKQKGFAQGDLHLVVSSCCSNDHTVRNLTHIFGNDISYNWIADSFPLTVTFNHTVMKSVEHFGAFDGYLYLDSGINFWDPRGNFDCVKILWDVHKHNNAAITAAMPSNDDGRGWWGINYPERDEYTFKVGETTNLHCQIYSEEFRKAYDGKLHCDIFANDTSESVTSYLTAAIKRKFLMTTRICVFHNAHLDGASFGWRGGQGIRKRLFITEKTMDERYLEGYQYGFGYEECNGNETWLHDRTMYDINDNALAPEALHQFLKRELFLSREQFDYERIAHNFVKGNL